MSRRARSTTSSLNRQQISRGSGWKSLAAIGAYLLATILLTYPTAKQIGSHIPGGGDAPWFLWQLWWFKHSLIDLLQSPLTTDLLYYPLKDVPVTWQTPFNEVFAIPLQFALSLPIHYTILTLLSFVLSGYFTYLLVLQLTRQHLVAFCAGLIFAFCGYRGARFVGHLSLLTTQWMPLALLLAIQTWRRPSWSKGVATGVGVGLVLLSSPYYLGLFILPVAFAVGLYVLIWNRQALRRRSLWQAALAAGLTSLLLCAPFFAQVLSLDSELYEITKKLSLEAESESADLLSWLLPPALNPIWGRWTAPLYAQFTTQNLVETTLYVGMITLVLAGATLFMRGLPRHTRFWQILAISALLLSFGPSLHFLGKTVFTWMPYRLLLEVPGFYAFRVPSRAGITAALALIVLAAIAYVQIGRRMAPRVRTVALLTGTSLIVANSLFAFPFPSTDVSVPDFYTEIRESEGRNAVLSLPASEFPLANRNYYELTSMSMYYQTVHQKPLVSGYLARRPERLYIPEQTMPFVRMFFRDGINRRIADLPRMDILPEHQWSTEAVYGNELLQRQGIEHVVLNCPARETEECWPATLLLKRALGLPICSSDGEQVFRTAPVHKRGVPETLLNLSPLYDHNVSAPFLNEYGRMREIVAPATITFTAPLPGAWRIQGDLLGTAALSTTLTLDGQPVQPFEIVQPGEPALRSFELDQVFAAGQHTLSVDDLAAQSDTESGRCGQLCLGNFSISLQAPADVETGQPLVTFVDQTGLHLELHEVRLVTVHGDALPLSPTTWLVTAWSTSDRSLRNRLADGTTAAPTLFVHLTDASGAIIGQADHLLAERFLWPDDEAHFYDVVELPTPENEAGQLVPSEIRLGLWYPSSGAYFWSPEEGTLDDGQRIRLPVEVLAQQSITVTDVARNAAVSASFASADDDRWFEIIDAYVIAHDPARADSPTELVTVWNVENIGHSVEMPFEIEAITLRVHFTDKEGNILAQADHILGSNNLSTLLGQRIYDIVAVPPELSDRDDVEVRIGLWIPETGERFPLQDARLNDGDGRARLGVVADLRQNSE